MGLKSIEIEPIYRCEEIDVVKNFFEPTLKVATGYYRGVGYFTLGALINLSKGIIGLIENGGRIKIVASPKLYESDIETIKKGYELDSELVTERLLEHLRNIDNIDEKGRLDLIANLIAANILDIKIAYKKRGIYHEKIGVIEDINCDKVAFIGSNNETINAQYNNYECMHVYKYWIEGIRDYAQDICNQFETLWENEVDGLEVMECPKGLKDEFISKYKISGSLAESIEKNKTIFEIEKDKTLKIDEDDILNKKLYPYQQEALNQFIENGFCHFYEMATGSGKTFTATKSIVKLSELKGKKFIIILVPKIDLQSQWKSELKDSGISNIYMIGGEGNYHWDYEFDAAYNNYLTKNESVYYISTYDSFFSKLLNKISSINSITENLVMLIDECHNITPNQLDKLPKCNYRLGLSATPERHNEDETKRILEYFLLNNQKTFRYTIEQAIEDGFLCRYNYYPIFVNLTEDEYKTYKEINQKIVIEKERESPDESKIIELLMKRSSIIKKAANKLKMLKQMVDSKQYDLSNSVIYCGKGNDINSGERIIDKVLDIITKNENIVASTYTSNTKNRKEVLKYFNSGFYNVLVAISCLDEGIDIPKLDKIFILSSDSLDRQTIQRRGRVLRKCKESGKEIAHIYDMVVIPPKSDINSTIDDKSSRGLVRNELKRVYEYWRLSENKRITENEINKLKDMYNI